MRKLNGKITAEAVIDFVEGGTTVYVLGFALGYGFW